MNISVHLSWTVWPLAYICHWLYKWHECTSACIFHWLYISQHLSYQRLFCIFHWLYTVYISQHLSYQRLFCIFHWLYISQHLSYQRLFCIFIVPNSWIVYHYIMNCVLVHHHICFLDCVGGTWKCKMYLTWMLQKRVFLG